MNVKAVAWVLTGCLLVLACGASQGAEANPTADEIAKRAIARDKELRGRRKIYTYTLKNTRDYLDDDGKVEKTETESQKVTGTQRVGYEVKTGAKSGGKDVPAKEKVDPMVNFSEIIGRFKMTLVGTETRSGVSCYHLRYTPREDQPFKNREEKVMNAMAGDVWVARDDYSIIHNEGKLSRDVSIAWVFATMKQLNYTFDTARLPNGDFGPSFLRYEFKVNAPFVTIHQRHTRRMTDYR